MSIKLSYLAEKGGRSDNDCGHNGRCRLVVRPHADETQRTYTTCGVAIGLDREATCQLSDECKPGMVCAHPGDQNLRCSTLCQPGAVTTGCAANESCLWLAEAKVGATQYGFCSTDCDPVTGGNCSKGTCRIFIGQLTATTQGPFRACSELTGAALGSPCKINTDCTAGHVCIGSAGSLFCRKLCEVTSGRGCTGQTCDRMPPPVTIGQTEYGFCN